jgi:anti-anti-sigma regulatory factor
MAMLRITTVKTNRQCRIVVEGELVSSNVEELKREWEGARLSAGCLTLIVDLRNVITIDQEGKDALLELMIEGVRFICGGVHNRHVLQQLARKINL